jgi:hypothetical protein
LLSDDDALGVIERKIREKCDTTHRSVFWHVACVAEAAK